MLQSEQTSNRRPAADCCSAFFDHPFGVRHHAEDIARIVEDAAIAWAER